MIILFWTIEHTGIGYKHTAYRSEKDMNKNINAIYIRTIDRHLDTTYHNLINFALDIDECYADQLALYILSQLDEVKIK